VTPDFESLVGGADLDEQERATLLAAHEALLLAGPPAELPAHLAHAPRPDGTVIPFPRGQRRAMVVLAAAIALVAFALGTATSAKDGGKFAAAWTHPMRGTPVAPDATASISGSKRDAAGNWKMLIKVTGLPVLHGNEYYVLWLTKHGRPIAQCGTFHVRGGTTVATFSEPYELHEFDGWVVTLWRGPTTKTGPALLRTARI
jgi:hypothetical protein